MNLNIILVKYPQCLESRAKLTSSEFALNYDGARSDCGMKVDLYSLCGKLTRAASDYYHSNKELFDFFQYQLIQ